MNKTFRRIAMCAMAGIISLGAVGCNNANESKTGANHCEIKAIKVGYGNDWLYETIKTFNELYKGQGYSVELTLEDSDIGAVNEIKRKNKNTTDLYLDYNRVNNLVESSYSILRDDKACLLEDLSDVVETVALNDNKKAEGTKTIKEKYLAKNIGVLEQGGYTGISANKEKYSGLYALPYATSTSGIYVNKVALEKLGYTTDDLLTTDALLDMCDDIVKDYNVNDKDYISKFFPIAYGARDASGYPSLMLDYWHAQYSGEQKYRNFWEFIPDTGTTIENGYDVYADEGLLESLRVVSDMVNTDIVQPGYASTSATAAQDRVFVGTSNANYKNGSLLMITGDWAYYEASKNNADRLDDVIAIKAPIISALGMKLGLCGTTHTCIVDGYTGRSSHCDDCEQKLRQIVKLSDQYNYEQKSNADIATTVGVPESSVKTIREARGYIIDSNDGACVAFIPSYADGKDVAKLFLRHLFSNDQQKIFMEKSYVDSIFEMDYENIDVSSMNNRERYMYEKLNSYNTTQVLPRKTNNLRRVIGTLYPATSTTVGVISGLAYSHKYSKPQYTPEEVFKNNMEYVEICWNDYLSAGGYYE